MLFELYDFGIEPRVMHVLLGLGLGLVFGIAAQVSRFCLRRAVAGDPGDRKSAAGVWMTGLAIAILAVQALDGFGLVALEDHRWMNANLPILALVAGGIVFGVGMVLTRGCVSRLSVLAPSGNLRALTVLLVFAIVAHSMLKGVLSPLRTAMGSVSVDAPVTTFAALPGGGPVWAAVIALPLLGIAARSGARPLHIALGALIGLVAALGWAGTSVLLMDEFDPLPVQSAAFTLPWSDTLFWSIASTAIPATFGVGFVGGVLGGAFLSALSRRELRLESFDSPLQTVRYGLGGALMGAGGVLAGGCTIGAGLAGGATLSFAAFIALVSIIAGGYAASAFLGRTRTAGATAAPA